MGKWKDYISILKCLNCGGNLRFTDTPKNFNQYAMVNGELICLSCTRNYPIFQDIPVMFKDNNITQILIDSAMYEVHLKDVEEKMQRAAQVANKELKQFKNGNDLTDALSWEILFWERWKQQGFIKHNRDQIEECLEKDSQGGGKLQFFNRILFFCENIFDKRLLNIGAGQDFLLEKFLEKRCEVIEQDIVLESLMFLRKRKASFCVCCDAKVLPFEDNTFDITTSFGVLHHIWPIEQPISELLRVTYGNIHFNEPNYFALVRVMALLPLPIQRKLKQWYKSAYSHSPYEASINPYLFKKIVKSNSAEVIDLSFTKSSWVLNKSMGIKRILRMIDLFLVNLLPLCSSHFDAVIRKAR